MYKPTNSHERALHRFKIAYGHLNKVIKMVEDRSYCIDVVHQSKAVQKALKETDHLIMENHLKTCASDAIKKGESENAILEIMGIFRKT